MGDLGVHWVDRETGEMQSLDTNLGGEVDKEGTSQSFSDALYGSQNNPDASDLSVDVGAEKEIIDSIVSNTGADVSLAKYMSDHPGADPEELLRYMSTQSDEYAEKYLDYMLEKKSLDANNQYSADREDSAYQRLVADLKKAGLNPAMMYGNSASPSASNSLGYLKMNEGANSRTVTNFSKLKNLLLAVLSYELYRKLDTTNQITKSGKDVTGMFKDLATVFSIFSS